MNMVHARWSVGAAAVSLVVVSLLASLATAQEQQHERELGAVFKRPMPWSQLGRSPDGRAVEWSVERPGPDGTGTHSVGQVRMCDLAQELEAVVQSYMAGSPFEMPGDGMLQCALEEELWAAPDYCGDAFRVPGSMGCQPLTLQVSPDAVRRSMEQFGVYPAYELELVPSAGMNHPGGPNDSQDDPHKEDNFGKDTAPSGFHSASPLVEFEIRNPSTGAPRQPDQPPPQPEDLSLRVEGDGPVRAFFVVANSTRLAEEFAGTDPNDPTPCEHTCSCTTRFIMNKVHYTGFRRQLRRVLQQDDMQSPLLEQLRACPGFGQCEADVQCDSDVKLFLEYGITDLLGNPLHSSSDVMEFLFRQPKDEGITSEMLFYDSVRCLMENMRQAYVSHMNMEGHSIPSESCEMEVEMCAGDSICRKLMTVGMFMPPHEQDWMLTEAMLSGTPDEMQMANASFTSLRNCLPVLMHDDGDYDGHYNGTNGEGPDSGSGSGGEDILHEIRMGCPAAMQSCDSSAECIGQLSSFLYFYQVDLMGNPLHGPEDIMPFVEQSTSAQAGSNFMNVVECMLDKMRSFYIEDQRQMGVDVDDMVCTGEVGECMADEVCRRIAVLRMFLHRSDADMYSLELQHFVPGATPDIVQAANATANRLEQCFPIAINHPDDGHDEGENGSYYPARMLAIPLQDMPCACGNGKVQIQSRRRTEFDPAAQSLSDKFESRLDLCFASTESLGKVQLQFELANDQPQADGGTIRGAQAWSSSSFSVDDTTRESLVRCVRNPDDCAAESRVLLEELRAKGAVGEAVELTEERCGEYLRQYTYTEESGEMRSCKPVQLRVPTERLIDGLSRTGRFPEVQVDMRPIDDLNNVTWLNVYDTLLYMDLTSDVGADFQSAEIELEDYHGVRSFTMVWDMPFVNDTVNGNNCHEHCACAALFLKNEFIDRHINGGEQLPLKVNDREIPCACSALDEGVFSEVTATLATSVDQYGYENRVIRSVISYCSFSEHLVETNTDQNAYNVDENWNWVCNCQDWKAFDACYDECRLARGAEWGWTCDASAEDGFRMVDQGSLEAGELYEQHCLMP